MLVIAIYYLPNVCYPQQVSQVIIKQNTFIKKLQSTVYGLENLWPLIDDHSDVGASYACVGQRPLLEFRRFKCGPRNYETLVFSTVRQNT